VECANCSVDAEGERLMTEAEIKKHLDAAEKSPGEIARAVTGLADASLAL
jgi:hypothetical protein